MARLDKRAARGLIAAAAMALVLGLAACGGDDNNKSTGGGTGGGGGGGGKEGGSINVVIGTAPDHIDPHQGYTTQSAELTWISYLGLVTYRHAEGEEGGQLIPALATDTGTVSEDGKTYEFTLRKGLKFSDGSAVKASDFTASVERMLKLNWGGKSFVTGYVTGAADYDAGKAKSISGITADDATGKITIKLDKPYGAFANVLAFPSLGVVPASTPKKDLSANPPPGVGPYKVDNVVVNHSYDLVKVPGFKDLGIPDVPAGHLDKISFTVVSNTQTEAEQVLNNTADVFDAGDTVPPALVPQIKSQAGDRFAAQPIPSTFYMFLNTTKPPFNNAKAREAVNVGVDRRAFQRLASGFMKPACYFLPEGIAGHPDGDCKTGTLDAPDIEAAKKLVQESGQANTKIVVWGERRAPRTEFVDYYTSALKKIGFKNVSEKIISDETYFPTIGNAKTDPQTGFADWIQDFPNPSDFYLLLDAASIQPVNNQNFSKVNDPKIQSELKDLNAVPANKLDSVADRWKALDEYVAEKGYVYVYGQYSEPQFFSNKINFDSAIFHPTYLNDFTSLQLK
jgi:peptide/nickel transport system substrate-binding protein